MKLIIDSSTDPYWNLAAEEYLLNTMDEPLLRIWRNSRSIIVGRNQNAIAEISAEYVRQNQIPVVRRLSGGGAVFHDLGNVNYSFFNVDKSEAISLVMGALRSMDLSVETSGRNDILFDGLKVSGTAGCKQGNHTLFHGTLLFDASIGDMVEVLKPRPEKFEGKAVKSVRSRVGNIREIAGLKTDVEGFMTMLSDFFEGDSERCAYSQSDIESIERLKEERYATDDWNFGKSPRYDYSSVKKFPGGLVELYLKINDGIIEEAEVMGDYFFERPAEEFCAIMKGCPVNIKKISDRLHMETIGQIFCDISPDELISLFP